MELGRQISYTLYPWHYSEALHSLKKMNAHVRYIPSQVCRSSWPVVRWWFPTPNGPRTMPFPETSSIFQTISRATSPKLQNEDVANSQSSHSGPRLRSHFHHSLTWARSSFNLVFQNMNFDSVCHRSACTNTERHFTNCAGTMANTEVMFERKRENVGEAQYMVLGLITRSSQGLAIYITPQRYHCELEKIRRHRKYSELCRPEGTSGMGGKLIV